MPRFAHGALKFQREAYPKKRELFHRLSSGQNPEALFITCADSRIETGLITQSEPGDLFILRNAGNIVPPHSNETGAMTASIEYAIGVLKIPHIVICGHTECGAMKGAMTRDQLTGLPHVKEWLGYSQGAVDVVEALCEGRSDDEKMSMLLEQNVKLQLQHLKTHPTVAVAMATGSVRLHGWVYDIRTGEIRAYDEETNNWYAVEQYYDNEISQIVAEDCSCAEAS
jgi:carbonic anhydrase